MPYKAFGVAAAVSALLTAPAAAQDLTRFELVWLPPLRAEAARSVPSLLNLPEGWRAGDAIAVVLFDPPAPAPLQDRIVGALLGHGAAVLEIDAASPLGFFMESDANPPPATVEELAATLTAALAALRRSHGAGLAVAIGYGLGGDAALVASGAGFAAHASLGPGAAMFRLGPAPPEAEAWPRRAPLLCEALAWAQAAAATPVAEPAPDAGGACHAALTPVGGR
jgi:hypothetical protein